MIIQKAKTHIQAVAAEGCTSLLTEILRSNNALVNAKDGNGQTALMAAAAGGRLSCLELIISSGAELNSKNSIGYTALHLVTMFSQLSCVELLLKSGAHVDARDSCGWTALHQAARSGQLSCVEALIKGGADINIRNDSGETALMCTSDLTCVKFLVSKGAWVHIWDNSFNSAPLSYSANKDIELFLYNRGACSCCTFWMHSLWCGSCFDSSLNGRLLCIARSCTTLALSPLCCSCFLLVKAYDDNSLIDPFYRLGCLCFCCNIL